MPQLRGAISDFDVTATANNNVTNVSAEPPQTLTAAQSAIEQIAATMKEAETTIISVRATIRSQLSDVLRTHKKPSEVPALPARLRLWRLPGP